MVGRGGRGGFRGGRGGHVNGISRPARAPGSEQPEVTETPAAVAAEPTPATEQPAAATPAAKTTWGTLPCVFLLLFFTTTLPNLTLII